VKNIETFIDDGGEITIGPVGPVACAATACDYHNAIVMLVRRDGETVSALWKRLDKAIARYYAEDTITDEINGIDD